MGIFSICASSCATVRDGETEARPAEPGAFLEKGLIVGWAGYLPIR